MTMNKQAAGTPAPTGIRLQMVAGGIPAYQNDFTSEAGARTVAESFALGAKAAKVEPHDEELFRFESKRTTIRAFPLSQRGA